MIMNYLKSAGLEFIFWGGVVVLFLLYLAGIKRKAKKEGVIEKTLEYVTQSQESIHRSIQAQKEFGTVSIEEIEENPTLRIKNKVNHKYAEIEDITPRVHCDVECLQFKKSPWQRD